MFQRLLDKIGANASNLDMAMIKKAYGLANSAHENQKRQSGEPYIIHPIEVAGILVEMGMDTNTICAGLLHDVIEDTIYTYEDIHKEFNVQIADLVQGLTKIAKIQYNTKEEQQADNVRKMLMAMAQDIRVIIIKLADRLHNMRTLKFKAAEKQRSTAKETLDIYGPLAHRLGMSKIKWELEDLSFRYLHPEEYYSLVEKIAEKRTERENYIVEIKASLTENLQHAGIKSDIDGRPKHFYSIYRKMVDKNKSIDQIFDLTAFRIIVDTIKDCYAALGIAHTIYKPIPGRFKDYIAMPKPNMYQSIHSTVIGPHGKTFEIQIRTLEMHKTAEYGIAAHWMYKQGINATNVDINLPWVGEMLEWQKDTVDATEFIQEFKTDLFSDSIFVFTPKGVVIDLPVDCTPIDFAYRIHTDVGNSCIGAKVNGKIKPLDYKLNTGEIVEIMTSPTPKGPSIEWLNIAKSNQAKSKIRAWFKKAKRDEHILKGKEMSEKEAKRQECNFGEIAKGEGLDQVLKKYNMHNLDEIFAAIGIGAMNASTLVTKLKDIFNKGKKPDSEAVLKEIEYQIVKNEKAEKAKQKGSSSENVVVKGVDNLLVRFAQCCNPVPGDEIIGYITKGRGVSVHRSDCSNVTSLLNSEENRKVEVSWGETQSTAYTAQIQIKSEDRNGLLSDIMEIITSTKTQLYAINAKTLKDGIAMINVKIKINDINHLKELMKSIKRLQGVREVYRTKY